MSLFPIGITGSEGSFSYKGLSYMYKMSGSYMNGSFANLFDNSSITGLMPCLWNGALGIAEGYIKIDFDKIPPINYITFIRDSTLFVRVEGYNGKNWVVLYDDNVRSTKLDCLRFEQVLPYSSYRLIGYSGAGYRYLYCLAFADTEDLAVLSAKETMPKLALVSRKEYRKAHICNDISYLNRNVNRTGKSVADIFLTKRVGTRKSYKAEAIKSSVRDKSKFANRLPDNIPAMRDGKKAAYVIKTIETVERKKEKEAYALERILPARRKTIRQAYVGKTLMPMRKRKVVSKRKGYVFIL